MGKNDLKRDKRFKRHLAQQFQVRNSRPSPICKRCRTPSLTACLDELRRPAPCGPCPPATLAACAVAAAGASASTGQTLA